MKMVLIQLKCRPWQPCPATHTPVTLVIGNKSYVSSGLPKDLHTHVKMHAHTHIHAHIHDTNK